jgi:hypothetical protein
VECAWYEGPAAVMPWPRCLQRDRKDRSSSLQAKRTVFPADGLTAPSRGPNYPRIYSVKFALGTGEALSPATTPGSRRARMGQGRGGREKKAGGFSGVLDCLEKQSVTRSRL